MKLYDVPRETFVRVLADIHTPIDSKPILASDIIFLTTLMAYILFVRIRKRLKCYTQSAFSEVRMVGGEELCNWWRFVFTDNLHI